MKEQNMASIHTASDAFMADLRRAYRAEYERSPALKEEFIEAADYAAFMIAESPTLIGKMRENHEMIEAEAARQRAIRAGLLHTRR